MTTCNNNGRITDKQIVVVCAAINFDYVTIEGVKNMTLSGVRHHAILQSELYQYFKNNYTIRNREEGFLTNQYLEDKNEYRFVGRITAKAIVEDFKQKVNNGEREECCSVNLYSEDLY